MPPNPVMARSICYGRSQGSVLYRTESRSDGLQSGRPRKSTTSPARTRRCGWCWTTSSPAPTSMPPCSPSRACLRCELECWRRGGATTPPVLSRERPHPRIKYGAGSNPLPEGEGTVGTALLDGRDDLALPQLLNGLQGEPVAVDAAAVDRALAHRQHLRDGGRGPSGWIRGLRRPGT